MSEQREFNLLDYRPEDGGILDCWMDLFGDKWLYVTGYECWYQWTGTHWAKDESLAIQRQIQQLMDEMNQAAKFGLVAAKADHRQEDEKLHRCYVQATKRTRSRIASVEGMAQAQRATAAGQLDAGNVLNLRNGTLDLDTITLRPHGQEDYQTYCLAYDYDPDATAPRFDRFLQEVLVNEEPDEAGKWVTDLELCTLFQELLGYSLTNDTRFEAMTWLSGDGGNGKTIAISVIQKLLGVLCCSVDFQTIGLPGNYDIAEIPGKRVIFSTESERGGKVAEGYIKRVVSGERINARAIYGKPFEFKSVSKVWWAMNDKPVLRDTGNAIWRRLRLIPFNRTFTDLTKDPGLLEKLERELPGILNFALDGLRRLRIRGRLPESAAVARAIEEYRRDSNPVQQWMEERTETSPEPVTLAKVLYEDYTEWCAGPAGRQPLNATNFGRELKRLRIGQKRTMHGVSYCLRLPISM